MLNFTWKWSRKIKIAPQTWVSKSHGLPKFFLDALGMTQPNVHVTLLYEFHIYSMQTENEYVDTK